MGEYNKAVEVYDKLIDRGESKAYSLKAYCLMQRNKTKEAIEVCDLGISEFPEEGEIYCTKYAIYAKQEKYKKGLKIIQKALKQEGLKNKQEVLFARISAYESLFDFDTISHLFLFSSDCLVFIRFSFQNKQPAYLWFYSTTNKLVCVKIIIVSLIGEIRKEIETVLPLL